jgi:hypothetical protein
VSSYRACAECLEPIRILSTGEDWLDYCEGCQQVEGEVIDLEEEDEDEQR